jgi:hypothetical protein
MRRIACALLASACLFLCQGPARAVPCSMAATPEKTECIGGESGNGLSDQSLWRVRPLHKSVTTSVRSVRRQHHRSLSISGLPEPLVRKVEEIKQHCPGFHVVSAYRPGARVAGSGRLSLHAVHKAVDIAGPHPQCAYARLHGWPGGVSIDYARVHHIHMSWSPHGHEWHARFAHWHGQRFAVRHRHYRQLAQAHRMR